MTTTIVTRTDSDGYEHQVCAQSQARTCVAASVFMAGCLRMKMSLAGGEDQIRKLAGRGNNSWAYGLNDKEVYLLLHGLCGVRHWEQSDDPARRPLKLSSGRVYTNRPAVVCVSWLDRRGRVTGGHAVVAPWFTDDGDKVVYLDPWQGQLVECLNDGSFSSKSGRGKIGFVCYT